MIQKQLFDQTVGKLLMFFISLLFLLSCKTEIKNKDKSPVPSIIKTNFGTTKNNESVYQYTLKNRNGMQISILNYGGIITSWTAKNRKNEFDDIVLGFDNFKDYENKNPYFGSIIGRYANRIEKGTFELNGTQYQLPVNDNTNHLHGGLKGFDKVIWEVNALKKDSMVGLELSYTSPDGEEGYPGNLNVFVTYALNDDNELSISYKATTDQSTIVNLTQHSYFNLSGDFNKEILDHEVVLNAASFLAVDATLIPTGEIKKVKGTPFDFTAPKKIGRDITIEDPQLKFGMGYDHCWVLTDQSSENKFVASAYDPESGRMLEVYSTEPGVQFYTGNFLDGSLASKKGGFYKHRTGFCLETQHFPNAPNEPAFPSTVLNPNEVYESQTTYKLSVIK